LAELAAVYAYGGSVGPITLVGERSIGGFFANLLMLQGIWARELSWNDPAWSISLEFLAYLLFPLLFSWLWRAAPATKAGIAEALPDGSPTAPATTSTNGTGSAQSCGACRSS
jgi:peptidoglycan/LPS O-acetylase OafA/YrhL